MSSERVSVQQLVFTCDKCGKTAVAGSKDLLENWEKCGQTAGRDAYGVWHPKTRFDYCGDCK